MFLYEIGTFSENITIANRRADRIHYIIVKVKTKLLQKYDVNQLRGECISYLEQIEASSIQRTCPIVHTAHRTPHASSEAKADMYVCANIMPHSDLNISGRSTTVHLFHNKTINILYSFNKIKSSMASEINLYTFVHGVKMIHLTPQDLTIFH